MKLIKKTIRLIDVLHTFLYRYKTNIKIGEKTIIYHKTKIITKSKDNKVDIGRKCIIGRSKEGYHSGMPFYTTLLLDKDKACVKIGDNCRINGAYIHSQKSVIIGDNCLIAAGVNILDSNGHKTSSYNRVEERDEPIEIIIGNNVWIGINSTILKNTRIGDNCIISAGSVVRGNFEPNCIISGVPAIEIKKCM